MFWSYFKTLLENISAEFHCTKSEIQPFARYFQTAHCKNNYYVRLLDARIAEKKILFSSFLSTILELDRFT